MFGKDPKIVKELGEIIEEISIQEIVNTFKGIQTIKMYDKEGKWCAVKVISKSDFLKMCNDYKKGGLS